MSIDDFYEKMIDHLGQFQEAVNSDPETSDVEREEDIWWERFIDFSMELDGYGNHE